MVKLTILVRKDLKIPPGKLAGQVGHASLAFLTAAYDGSKHFSVTLTDEERRWFTDDRQTKIVCGVETLAELEDLRDKAVAKGLTVRPVIDAGLTIFKEPTLTCIAIGPHESDLIDSAIGRPKLL